MKRVFLSFAAEDIQQVQGLRLLLANPNFDLGRLPIPEKVLKELRFSPPQGQTTVKKMRKIVIFLLMSLVSIAAIAQDIPEHVKRLATEMGIVYEGMPKESLYQVFSDLQQKGYRKDGTDEWITFSDWTTEEPGDLITFHLKDGKVAGWSKPGAEAKESAKSEI